MSFAAILTANTAYLSLLWLLLAMHSATRAMPIDDIYKYMHICNILRM